MRFEKSGFGSQRALRLAKLLCTMSFCEVDGPADALALTSAGPLDLLRRRKASVLGLALRLRELLESLAFAGIHTLTVMVAGLAVGLALARVDPVTVSGLLRGVGRADRGDIRQG